MHGKSIRLLIPALLVVDGWCGCHIDVKSSENLSKWLLNHRKLRHTRRQRFCCRLNIWRRLKLVRQCKSQPNRTLFCSNREIKRIDSTSIFFFRLCSAKPDVRHFPWKWKTQSVKIYEIPQLLLLPAVLFISVVLAGLPCSLCLIVCHVRVTIR